MRFPRCFSLISRTPASCQPTYGRHACLVSIILIACALAGCSTPTPPSGGLAVDLDFLVSKPISRDTIIQKLGTPSVSLEEGAILTYRIAHRPEFPGYYIISGNQSGKWNGYSLVLVFDSQGLLQKHSLVEVYKRYDNS